ncbi:MAG: calcium/sodium antiporter [Planctomycetota bacterium]|jgi:cation:H+ antiporter|nr:calcium/sodium antiporter [Planctomycetota bacterium]
MPEWYNHPHLLVAVVFIIVGFAALIKGADLLVAGAVTIAKRWGLPPAVIGATIVAFGTSLPELVVTLGSGLKAIQAGQGGNPNGPAAIAIGNVVGSNIFNIGAILGITAMVRAVPVPKSSLRLDYPLMMVSLAALVVFSVPWGGGPAIIGRLEGLVLVLGLVAFTFFAIRGGKVDPADLPADDGLGRGVLGSTALILGGIVLLAVGGEVSLTGAITVARALHMSDRVIGVTVMAIGTSLPELATSIQAVRKGHTEIAVSNVIGSNIFNVLCIVGLTALVLPLPVADSTLHWDYWWMMGFGVVLLPILVNGCVRQVTRIEGVLLAIAVVTYVVLVLTLNMDPEPPPV